MKIDTVDSIAGGAATTDTTEQIKSTMDTTSIDPAVIKQQLNDKLGAVSESASKAASKVGNFMSNMTSKATDAVAGVASTMTDTVDAVSSDTDTIKQKLNDKLGAATDSASKVGNFMSNMKSKAKDAVAGVADVASTATDIVDTIGAYPGRAITPNPPSMLQNFTSKQEIKNKNNNKKPMTLGNYTETQQGNDTEDDDAGSDEDDKLIFQNISQVARETSSRVYDSGSNLVITQFIYMLDKTVDLITYFGLGYRSLNSVDKEEIISNLKGKRDILMQIAYDPVGQKIVKDMSFALATIMSEVIDAAGPPLSVAQQKLSNSLGSGVDKVSARIMESLRNMVRIIPGAGDAFIIMENVFKIGQVATELGKTAAKSSQTIANTYMDVRDKTLYNPIIKEQLDFFSKSTSEFQNLRDKIAAKVGKVIPTNIGDDANERLKIGIRDTGKKVKRDFDEVRSGLLKQHKQTYNGGAGTDTGTGTGKRTKHKLGKIKGKSVFRTRRKRVQNNLKSSRKKKYYN